MVRKANSCLFGVAAIALLMGAVGCSPTEPTQIVAGMVTQMRVPEEIRSVGLIVQSDGKQIYCDNYKVDDETHSVTLPSTFSASSRGDVTKPLTITVLGFPQNDPAFEADCYIERTVASGPLAPQIMRRRRSTFVLNEMLYMPMPLRHSCDGVQCNKDQTCIAGKCQSMVDDATNKLGRYDEELVFGRASTCFDVSTCADPNMASMISAVLKDRKTCEFEVKIPDDVMNTLPKDAGLNVSIVHENFTWELLDQDQREGFFLTPDGDGLTRFRLAEGLCEERFRQGKITNVMVNVGCPSKVPLHPLCERSQKGIIGGTLGPSSVVNRPPLMEPRKLEAVNSAVLILLDDRQMREDLIKWAKRPPQERENENELIAELRKTLDNPVMSNLHIGIAVSSDVEKPFELSDFSVVFDRQTQSIDEFVDLLWK